MSEKMILERVKRYAHVSVPYSKSMAARALILSYVFGDVTQIAHLPDCDDTRELAAAIAALRANHGGLSRQTADTDCIGQVSRGHHEEYNLGSGGTSLRFFLALVASLPGVEARIDCSDALRTRPLKPLVDALVCAGADITYVGEEGCAPLEVRGARLDGTGVTVSGAVSSQFRSALMLVSPLWSKPFCADSDSDSVSRPYIDMTRRMVDVFASRRKLFEIEPDWSALSYFYEYALLRPGMDVIVDNMPLPCWSFQGDSACAKIFKKLGVDTIICGNGTGVLYGDIFEIGHLAASEETVGFDMRDVPDLVPALAVGLCFAGIRFRMDGVGHLRHKESDRLTVLSEELLKAGFILDVGPESLSWNGSRGSCAGECIHDSHGDHRIAMALAVTTVCRKRVEICGAEAVTKSFPEFFRQLANLDIQNA